MIFLSHNYKDKDVVGPIAVSLANRYGKENVFYDSWSIKPGDGIINEMNNGLEKCKYFFFFISENSLKSGMVSLEWQVALNKSTKGETKFIPIKVDNSKQPTILIDKIYIDMYNIGMQQSLQQIIDIIDNTDSDIYNSTYSNVYYELKIISKSEVDIIVKARRFIEHTPTIDVSFSNELSEIDFKMIAPPNQNSFARMTVSLSGKVNNFNCRGIKSMSQDLTPEQPLYFKVKNINQLEINHLQVWIVNGEKATLLKVNN